MFRNAVALVRASKKSIIPRHEKKFISRPWPKTAGDANVACGGLRRWNTTTKGTPTTTTISSYQDSAADFLDKVADGRIQYGIVNQKVEELFLQIVTQENIPPDGPMALKLLNVALQHANQHTKDIEPRLFCVAIQIMLQSGHPLAVKEVEKQLMRLLNGPETYFASDYKYNTHHVNDAFLQYIRHVVAQSHQRKRKIPYERNQVIQKMMKRLDDLYADASVPLLRSPGGCDAVVMYHCNQRDPNKAYEILKWMVNDGDEDDGDELSQEKKYSIRVDPPWVTSFTSTIAAFAKTGNPDKSLEIIHWMLSSYKKVGSRMPPPHRVCFNALLDAWAKSGSADAGEKAEHTLKWMQQISDEDDEGILVEMEPDEISYSSCINAWAGSSHPEAPYRAEALLQTLVGIHRSGKVTAPTSYAFTAAMHAWANSNRDEAPERIINLIEHMHEFANSMDTMEVGVIPYTILIKAWENRASKSSTTGEVLKQCGDEIIHVMDRMKLDNIPPTPGVYNAMVTALRGISAPSSVFYFLELEDDYRNGLCKLDTRTFNCGLNAMSAMNKPDVAEKASSLLRRMFEYSKTDPTVHPDETTFNVMLKILSRSNLPDAAERATSLLLEMDGIPSIKPSHWSYIPCMMAWGRSKSPEKFQKVRDLIVRYEHLYRKGKQVTLNTSVYNAVLSVCYHNDNPELQQEAIDAAIATIDQLRKTRLLRADQTTYQSLFRVLSGSRNGDEGKYDDLAEREFRSCMDDGLVSPEIVQHLYRVSPRTFQAVFGDNADLSTASIPRSWSRNNSKKRR